jgi:hypothetical protein
VIRQHIPVVAELDCDRATMTGCAPHTQLVLRSGEILEQKF